MKKFLCFLVALSLFFSCFVYLKASEDEEIKLTEADSAKDVAEALSELEDNPDARLIVFGDSVPEDSGAKEIIRYEEYDEYILQFGSEDEAAQAKENLEDEYDVWEDVPVTLFDNMVGNLNTYTYGTTLMGVDFYLNGVPSAVDKVVVGVVDSGVDSNNPFFKDGVILKESCSFVRDKLTDTSGHGTHVCGIIADMTPSQVKILAVGIFEDGQSTLSLALTGIQYCIEHNVDVINLSFGSYYKSSALEEVLERAVGDNIVVVCATGNSSDEVCYPASSPETIAVGAITSDCKYAYFSNYGEEVDFCAPGSWVESAAPTTGKKIQTVEKSGTSMAAPHISAIYAYMKLAYPSATCSELYNLVKKYCVDIDASGWDERTGWGYPNISDLFSVKIKMGDCIVPHFKPNYNIYYGEPVKQDSVVRYNGINLKEGIDYKISYKNNNKIGTATITYTGLGKFTGTLKKTYKIIPRFVDIKELSQYGKGAVFIKYKSVKGGCKYQIAYRLKGSKTWTKVSTTNTQKIIKNLKRKKTYYFKVRAYKKVDGTNYIGDWSDTWSVTTK